MTTDLMRQLHAVLLHVHDGLRNLHVDGVHDGLEVKGTLEPIRQTEHGV